MSSDVCRSMRQYLGVYALGSLEPGPRAALLAHLDGCAECRAEAAALAAVVRALPLADPLRSDRRPRPSEGLDDAIVERIAAERAERRHARVRKASVAALAAAAVVAAVVTVAGIVGDSRRTIELAGPAGADGYAALEYHSWGTEIRLDVSGLPREHSYGVWLERDDGERVPAGSFWTPEEGPVKVTLTAAMNLRDCKGVGISDADGDTVLHSEFEWSE